MQPLPGPPRQGWLRKRLGNAFDTADLAHDTYVRVLSSGQVPQPARSRRNLTQIAKGLAIGPATDSLCVKQAQFRRLRIFRSEREVGPS